MGGAATVTGALAFAITRGLNKRVKLYLCCADNLISGNALSRRHHSLPQWQDREIMNTDAEGLCFAGDGLIDASAQKPELIIDAATLTGAAKPRSVMTTTRCSALMTRWLTVCWRARRRKMRLLACRWPSSTVVNCRLTSPS